MPNAANILPSEILRVENLRLDETAITRRKRAGIKVFARAGTVLLAVACILARSNFYGKPENAGLSC